MLNIFLYMHKKTDCEVFWPIKGKAGIYKDKIQKKFTQQIIVLSSVLHWSSV